MALWHPAMIRSASDDDDDDDSSTDSAVFIDQFVEALFQPENPEKWSFRRIIPSSPPHKRQKTHQPQLLESLGKNEEILGVITSFLDPHDMMPWFSTCTTLWQISKEDFLFKLRLASVLGYFRVTKDVADIWKRFYGTDFKSLVCFFEYVALKMQAIYGSEYVVHPIHRALLVTRLLGVDRVPRPDNTELDDEDEDPRAYLPATFQSDRSSWEAHLCMRHNRFSWHAVIGDRFQSVDPESWHAPDLRDEDMNTNLLNCSESVWIYHYQDEDNQDSVGIYVGAQNEVKLEGGMYFRDEDGDPLNDPATFTGLTHFYVTGFRGNGMDPRTKPSRQTIVHRLEWLYRLRLLEGAIDWHQIYQSVGMDCTESLQRLNNANGNLAKAADYYDLLSTTSVLATD